LRAGGGESPGLRCWRQGLRPPAEPGHHRRHRERGRSSSAEAAADTGLGASPSALHLAPSERTLPPTPRRVESPPPGARRAARAISAGLRCSPGPPPPAGGGREEEEEEEDCFFQCSAHAQAPDRGAARDWTRGFEPKMLDNVLHHDEVASAPTEGVQGAFFLLVCGSRASLFQLRAGRAAQKTLTG
ncbi:unnamed protein product, partial [Prorocentrum cordatum]